LGLVIQFQRRAIEGAFTKTPITIAKETEFRLNGRRLNLLGVSPGFGTCSDIWGVDIAVLGQNSETEPVHPSAFPIRCQGLILLRNLLPDEYEDQKKSKWYVGQPLLMVEGLEIKEEGSQSNLINLRLNGRKSSYVHLV
jgi:hypothetical protein